MRVLSVVLMTCLAVACTAETGAGHGHEGAAGSSPEVALKTAALVVGTWTFKNSNNQSNMSSATATNLLRGIMMGEPNVSWSCQAVLSPAGAKCTAVGGSRNYTVSSCVAIVGSNPPAKNCVIKENNTTVGTVRWSIPTGRWWNAQGTIDTPVLRQGFNVANTCSPNNESCWRTNVFNR